MSVRGQLCQSTGPLAAADVGRERKDRSGAFGSGKQTLRPK